MIAVTSKDNETVFICPRAIAFVQKHAEDTYWTEIHLVSGKVIFCTEDSKDIYAKVTGKDYF